MIRFQSDADLDYDIVLAVRRRERAVDFASASGSGVVGLSDPEVLEIAAIQGRILITHVPPKNEINQSKHGIDFETAQLFLMTPSVQHFVERVTDGEERWYAIGSIEQLIIA